LVESFAHFGLRTASIEVYPIAMCGSSPLRAWDSVASSDYFEQVPVLAVTYRGLAVELELVELH